MKLKSFQSILEERLNKEEIAEIREQAELEIKALRSLQEGIKSAVNNYMEKNNIGFNEMVRRLNSTPTQFSKIQQGKANLTFASLAHFSALIGQEPTLTFKKK